jgi:hypothetical protein
MSSGIESEKERALATTRAAAVNAWRNLMMHVKRSTLT